MELRFRDLAHRVECLAAELLGAPPVFLRIACFDDPQARIQRFNSRLILLVDDVAMLASDVGDCVGPLLLEIAHFVDENRLGAGHWPQVGPLLEDFLLHFQIGFGSFTDVLKNALQYFTASFGSGCCRGHKMLLWVKSDLCAAARNPAASVAIIDYLVPVVKYKMLLSQQNCFV